MAGQWGHVKTLKFLEDPNPHWPHISSLKVTGGFHDQLEIKFGPGLNAVIGGKGAGKSALIEILRHSLEAGAASNPELAVNLQRNFRANAEAEVTFLDNGQTYEVRRSGDPTPARLSRNGQVLEVPVNRRITVRIFGQRELQGLVEQPSILREFIASTAGPAWTDAQTLERELLTKLCKQAGSLESLDAELRAISELETELADLRDQLKRLEEIGAEELIRSAATLTRVDVQVTTALGWPKVIRGKLESISEVPVPGLPAHPRIPTGIAQVLSELDQKLGGSLDALLGQVSAAETSMNGLQTDWQLAHDEERRTINQQLADAGVSDLEDLATAQKRVVDLEAKVADAPQKREQGEALTTERRQLLDELAQGRREESRLVEEAARALRQRVGRRVRVVVNPLSDRSQVLELLQNAVRGQSVRRDQLDKLSETPPSSLAAAIRAGADELLKLGCSDATAARIGAMPLSVVHQIEEAATPDAILIEVDLGAPGNEQWSSVKKVSPGQRATAMLALALATGTEPLIIDQPEDDLDNRYIFDEVVSVIANVCEGRQVLVATHNANIPILGDAELVIAFDAVADRSVVMACGPLEEPTVAQKAREILEGGDEAFMARHRRYLSARKELER